MDIQNKNIVRCYELPKCVKRDWIILRLSAGYCTKQFKNKHTGEIIRINPAVMYVYCSYIKENSGVLSERIRCEVEADVAYIILPCHENSFKKTTVNILKEVLINRVNEEKFETAKKRAMDKMRLYFKAADYRSWMYLQEFVHQRKGFRLQDMLKEMQQMTYEEFCFAVKKLINSENINIVLGRKKPENNYSFLNDVIKEHYQGKGIFVPDYTDTKANISQEDWAKIENARQDYQMGAVRLDFEDDAVDALERKIIIDCIAVLLYQNNVLGYSDGLDSCILYWEQPWKEHRKTIPDLLTVENCQKAGQMLLLQTEKKMREYPELFLKECLQLEVQGIEPGKYIQMIQKDFVGYLQKAIEKSRICITEGKMRYQKLL